MSALPEQSSSATRPVTGPPSASACVAALRRTFESGRTRGLDFRSAQLAALERMLAVEEAAILEALHADLGKPRLEGWASEISEVASAVRYLRRHLKRWMRPTRVSTPLVLQPGKSWIEPEPLGVVLVMAPWNFPLRLTLNPLAGALAAGNTVLVKPSEIAPAMSALLARLLPAHLDPEVVQVIEGGVEETTALLTERFDHIFYTGNGHVGRIVLQAAAKHLTPVTLELGGKSPCIVDADADLTTAAKRIAWAKFWNCGQTCVAPDYLLVHKGVHDRFLALLKETVVGFWGERPSESVDYARIVNERHHRRLMALLDGGGTVVLGGESDLTTRYFAPTVLTEVPSDARVMDDEIFGPILPVLPVADVAEAVRFIRARPKPLALYLFAANPRAERAVIEGTSSGGVVINHAVVHLAVPGLPFGGVGASGMGAYHGKFSFDTFSHHKPVLRKSTLIDPPLVYPPYTRTKERVLRWLL